MNQRTRMWEALAWLRMGTNEVYTNALGEVIKDVIGPKCDESVSDDAALLARRIQEKAVELSQMIAQLEEKCQGTKTRECYYFGCQGDAGHYWWDAEGPRMSRKAEARVGEKIASKIDGGFCPGVSDNPNRPYARTRPEVEGEAALHYLDGWTVLAFWDRSVDKRGGCNSNFVVRGHATFDEVLALAKEQYPQVMNRLTFQIKLVTRFA